MGGCEEELRGKERRREKGRKGQRRKGDSAVYKVRKEKEEEMKDSEKINICNKKMER